MHVSFVKHESMNEKNKDKRCAAVFAGEISKFLLPALVILLCVLTQVMKIAENE